MTYDAHDYVTMGLFIACAFCAGCGIGCRLSNLAHYYRGRHDGANTERSRANARIIAAKLEACHKGRLAERAVHFQN